MAKLGCTRRSSKQLHHGRRRRTCFAAYHEKTGLLVCGNDVKLQFVGERFPSSLCKTRHGHSAGMITLRDAFFEWTNWSFGHWTLSSLQWRSGSGTNQHCVITRNFSHIPVTLLCTECLYGAIRRSILSLHYLLLSMFESNFPVSSQDMCSWLDDWPISYSKVRPSVIFICKASFPGLLNNCYVHVCGFRLDFPFCAHLLWLFIIWFGNRQG